MKRSLLSRYHPRYIRSLVYMLQASEYSFRDYLAWYWRTRDFFTVERRKHLVKTPKVWLLLVSAWGMLGGVVSLVMAFIFLNPLGMSLALIIVFALASVLVIPFGLGYGMVIPLLIIKIVQFPVEYGCVQTARRRLKDHPGLKIAVAGSYGKTTMREILKSVLSAGKKVATPAQNYNTPIGMSRFVKTLTGDEEVLIFELGEYYPGDVKKLCHLVQPSMGIITGVNEAHLQKFHHLDRTARTVFELADYLGKRVVYVNAENEYSKSQNRPGEILYSRHGVGDWNIEQAKTDLSGTSFVMRHASGIHLNLTSSLLGLHHVGPIAVAVDIAFGLGFSPEQIQSGVAQTQPFPNRLQPKLDETGVWTLDDSYNGNPDGVHAVIQFLAGLQDHRRWYVTPGLVEMGERTEGVHKQIGKQLAEAQIEKVVLIRNSVTPLVAQELRETNYRGEILWFDDALTALVALPLLTVKGDVVVLQNDWPDNYI